MSLRRVVIQSCFSLIWIVLLAAACSAPGGPTPALPEPTSSLPGPVASLPITEEVPLPASATAPVPSATTAAPESPAPASETPPATDEPIPTAAPSISESPQLAFLKDGDIWLLDSPDSRPYQLTLAGDILSYAWAPDGERLAAFNGLSLCFFQRDGSVRTACLELGLSEEQAGIVRQIAWSPDARWIVLWNSINPQDEEAIGWLVVALDTSNATWRIQDPVDWGAALAPNNEPGGFTGQPLFLSDGRLVGTLSHRYLCGSGGCRYQLYEFDLASLTPSFIPFPNQPEEGWSEGRSLLLSPDGNVLTNYGAFLFGCDSAHTFIDRFDLATQARQTYSLEDQAVESLAFSPDQQMAVLARTSACSAPEETTWSQSCGLSQGFEILPMQRWEPESNEIDELPPGLEPVWSPDGEWIAFRSCLAQDAAGEWTAGADTPAAVYLLDGDGEIVTVSEGSLPSWRPR